jgi:hypothetical protein
MRAKRKQQDEGKWHAEKKKEDGAHRGPLAALEFG